MKQYSPALVIDILRKDYPEVDSQIRQRIDESIPSCLTDLNLVPAIIQSFKKIKAVDYSKWESERGCNRGKVHEDRELLLAVLLLLYQPEKILKMTNVYTKHRLLSTISKEINCSVASLKMRVPITILSYKAYKEFKKEAFSIYEQIKLENDFFQN